MEDLGHVFEPARKCRRRISSMEQKLLKIHGISSEARVNLRRLKPPDIKILSQKCVSDGKISSKSCDNKNDSELKCKTTCIDGLKNNSQTCNNSNLMCELKNVKVILNKSKIIKDFIDSSNNSQNLRNSILVNSDKNLDFTDKTKLVNSKTATEKRENIQVDVKENSVCNKDTNKEGLKNIRRNSLLDCSRKDSNEKTSDTKSEDRIAAIKLIEEKLKSIKKNPLIINDSNTSGKSLISDTVKIIPPTVVNNHTKVDSLKEDSLKSFPSSISVPDETENLKDVRLNSMEVKQEKIEKKCQTKPLIILDVDKINKNFSTEKQENSNVNSLNCEEKSSLLSNKLEALNFKPPPVREFTLKDFGLDTSAKKSSPCTSKTVNNNIDKYLKEKCSVTQNDTPPSAEPNFESVKYKQEERIKKYSLEELGLSCRRVRTLGLRDFTEPNARVFGVKDFKVKPPSEGTLDNRHNDLRKSLRNFRLDNLKDVKTSEDVHSSSKNEETRSEVFSSENRDTEGVSSQTASAFISEGRDRTSSESVENDIEFVMVSDKEIDTNSNGIGDENTSCQKDDNPVLDHIVTSTTNCSDKEVETDMTNSCYQISKPTDSNDPLMVDPIESHKEHTPEVDDLNSRSVSTVILNNRLEQDNCDSQREADNDNLSSIQKLPSCDNNICEVQINIDSLSNTGCVNDNTNNSRTDVELNSNASKFQKETVLESSTTNDLSLCNTDCSIAQKVVSISDATIDLGQPEKSINNSNIITESNQGTQNSEAEILVLDDDVNSEERTTLNSDGKKETSMNSEIAKSVIIDDINSSNTKLDVDNLNKCIDVNIQAVTETENHSVKSNQFENIENNILGSKAIDVPPIEVTAVFNGPNNVLPTNNNNNSCKTISSNCPFIPLSLGGKVSQSTDQIHSAMSTIGNYTDLSRNSNNVKNNQEDKVNDRIYDEVLSDVEIHDESISEACDFDIYDYDDDNDIEIIESRYLGSGKSNEDHSSGLKSSNGDANVDNDLEIIMENHATKTKDNEPILVELEQNLALNFKKGEGLGVSNDQIKEKNKDDLSPIVKRLKSNDYNIKKLFLPSKKNNSTFASGNISNLNHHFNNLKDNNKFRKDERVEDCSYDYPKFSVLDTEGLIRSYRNLVCGSCFKHVDVKFVHTMGTSGTEFEVECFSCNHIRRFKRSKSCVNEVDFNVTGYDNLYLKLVYSCLDFGGGYNQLQSTCLALNIPHLNKKSYGVYCSYILSQAEEKLNTVLKATAEIIHNAYENKGISASPEGIREISILLDSWIPKGKREKYCLVVAIDLLTGLVLDFYLVVNYCQNCCIMRKKKNFESWKLRHKSLGQCHINWSFHEDDMESEASRILCSRSEQKYKFKYSCASSNVLNLPQNTNFNSANTETAKDNNTDTCDLNLSDTALYNEKNNIDYIESDITSNTLEQKEMATVNEMYSKTELSSIASSPQSDEKNVLNSSTPVKVSMDPCDSNCALEIQSTSSLLTLTNINSISNGDSDKELQEFNKSPNHILEEINIDLNLDLDNLVPSVTSSDTLSEGLLEGNGVLVHRDGISLADNEPMSIEAMNHLGNQCINEEISDANISETSNVNDILMLDVQPISNNKKELSNIIPEAISNKNYASSLFQKSDNNSILGVSEKPMHNNDSTTIIKQVTSVVDVNKELVNKEMMMDVQSVSENKRELSNIILKAISDKNDASDLLKKSDNKNSLLNKNEKLVHNDDSTSVSKHVTSIVNVNEELDNKVVEQTISTKVNNPITQNSLEVGSVEVVPILITNERQDESLVSNDKLSNSITYDEHREMASLLASNVVDQDVSTDFEKSVSKENMISDLKDEIDNLEQDIVERDKDLKGLLNEESGERCTINEVSELVVDDASVNEKSDDLCDMSILSENIESNGKKNEIQAQETTTKVGSINENTEYSSETKNAINDERNVEFTDEKDNDIVSLSDNTNIPTLNNSHNTKEYVSDSERIHKLLKKVKKDSLRSNVLKTCNSSAPITKELVEFACNQAIILHNINVQNLDTYCSSIT